MSLIIGILIAAPIVVGLTFALVVYPAKALGVGDQRASGPAVAVNIGQCEFATEVVGESNYQDALRSIAGKPSHDGRELFVEAALVLDDANPYDAQAVKVQINDKLVGFLSREDARAHRGGSTGSVRTVRRSDVRP